MVGGPYSLRLWPVLISGFWKSIQDRNNHIKNLVSNSASACAFTASAFGPVLLSRDDDELAQQLLLWPVRPC